MRKTLFLAGVAACTLAASAAHAGIDLDVNIGTPVYAAPAPVVVAPQPGFIVHPWLGEHYDPHHRASDYRYWQNRRHHDYR